MADLSTIAALWRADAEALRRHGDPRIAAALEKCATEAEASDEVKMTAWVDEGRALTQAGVHRRTLARHRAEWVDRGWARETARGWEYRVCALPDASSARTGRPRPDIGDVHALLRAG